MTPDERYRMNGFERLAYWAAGLPIIGPHVAKTYAVFVLLQFPEAERRAIMARVTRAILADIERKKLMPASDGQRPR